MTNSGSANTSLRGKKLHPDMSRRVLSLYNTGHYSEAVLAAFKVVEERLRIITDKPEADRKELLKATFNPTTGTLHDAEAWQSERVGIYNFIDGAFLSFRNPSAHRFVETNDEEAFDLIVLANRILLLIEERHRGLGTELGAEPKESRPAEGMYPALLDSLRSTHALTESDEKWILDTNNDGSDEIVTPNYVDRGQVIDIAHFSQGNYFRLQTEQVEPAFNVTDVLLADVDNDGQQEVVCIALAAYNSLTLFYKYRDGKYAVLRKDPDTTIMEGSHNPWFFNAQVVDVDGDEQIEVVSEPKESGYLPPPTRYVWKWNEEYSYFQLLYTEALLKNKPVHVTPHGDKWAVMREGNKRASSLHDTQKEAEQKGRQTARKDKTEFFLHNRGGEIRQRDRYGHDPFPPGD